MKQWKGFTMDSFSFECHVRSYCSVNNILGPVTQLDIFFKNTQIPSMGPSRLTQDRLRQHVTTLPKHGSTQKLREKETPRFGPREVYSSSLRYCKSWVDN